MARKQIRSTISENRRQQNRLSQKRWREKRKSDITAKALNDLTLSGQDENVKRSRSNASKKDSLRTDSQGEVSAKDIIYALALPDDEDDQSMPSTNNTNWQMTSLKDIDPQNLSESQLLSLAYCSPSISLTFSLQSIHFAKALILNTNKFGFDLKFMSKTESVSFIAQDWSNYLKQSDQNKEKFISTSDSVSSIEADSSLRWKAIPKNMLPTEDQLTIKHHPYIDVTFPWPKMRSKVLKTLYTVIDYNDFCDAVFKAGLPGAKIKEPAFYIWGDEPMDESAWEVGERFAKQYWFLLDDAIISRTNWWRRLRELKELPLHLKEDGID